MSNGTYKRGQAEWALWRTFTFARLSSNSPPAVFRTRIKRLLELDRDLDVRSYGAAPPCDFAFAAPSGGGSGVETHFAPFDVFCLAIALDLLDVGFKQGEIVYLMRHLRDTLDDWFEDLIKRPSLIDRQQPLAKDHPDLPVIVRDRRAPVADARVFLILNRIEMTELMPSVRSKAKALFLDPELCEGISRLHERLDFLMPDHRRTIIALEIASPAQAVSAFLREAPLVPRGRPPSRRT